MEIVKTLAAAIGFAMDAKEASDAAAEAAALAALDAALADVAAKRDKFRADLAAARAAGEEAFAKKFPGGNARGASTVAAPPADDDTSTR